jgi:hypothetical protein
MLILEKRKLWLKRNINCQRSQINSTGGIVRVQSSLWKKRTKVKDMLEVKLVGLAVLMLSESKQGEVK